MIMRRRGRTARESGELFALLIRQACFSRGVNGVLVICITLMFACLHLCGPERNVAQPRSGPFRGRRCLLRAPVRRTLLSNSTP